MIWPEFYDAKAVRAQIEEASAAKGLDAPFLPGTPLTSTLDFRSGTFPSPPHGIKRSKTQSVRKLDIGAAFVIENIRKACEPVVYPKPSFEVIEAAKEWQTNPHTNTYLQFAVTHRMPGWVKGRMYSAKYDDDNKVRGQYKSTVLTPSGWVVLRSLPFVLGSVWREKFLPMPTGKVVVVIHDYNAYCIVANRFKPLYSRVFDWTRKFNRVAREHLGDKVVVQLGDREGFLDALKRAETFEYSDGFMYERRETETEEWRMTWRKQRILARA